MNAGVHAKHNFLRKVELESIVLYVASGELGKGQKHQSQTDNGVHIDALMDIAQESPTAVQWALHCTEVTDSPITTSPSLQFSINPQTSNAFFTAKCCL